ncbi:MAG: hypothetical protein IJ884_10490 [Bacteroidales bacterium]|nr:hypothetical protein [Bacteroidales bacterium]
MDTPLPDRLASRTCIIRETDLPRPARPFSRTNHPPIKHPLVSSFVPSILSTKEISYVLWRHHLRFIDENRIAGLNLEDETLSQLKPQASGNAVLTSSDYSKWSTSRSETQSTGEVNGENETAPRHALRAGYGLSSPAPRI